MMLELTLNKFKRQKATCSLVAARLWRLLRSYRIDFGLLFASSLRSMHSRRSRQLGGAGDKPRKILVIRLDAMGDLVMTTLLFRELKLRYQNAVITAVVQRGNKDLLETNPYVDRILHPPEVNKSRVLQLLRREYSVTKLYWKHLSEEAFDIALQPRVGPDYYGANLLLKLVDAPVSVKYADIPQKGPGERIRVRAFRSMTNLPRPESQHEVLSNIELAERLTCRPNTSHPEIFLTESDLNYATGVVTNSKPDSVIISVAFGARAKRRSWPLERWAAVIHSLAKHRSIFALLICSKDEEKDGKQLRSMLHVESRLLCGARLREAAACLKASNLLLGPDSGLAHLAAGVGCRAVVVSPHPADGDPNHENSPVRFGPYSHGSRVIQPKAGIPPCQNGCDAVEAHCILQITAEEVSAACEEILRSLSIEQHRSDSPTQRISDESIA